MAEFIEIIMKDSKVQIEISQTFEKHNQDSCSTQAKIGQKALTQVKSWNKQ